MSITSNIATYLKDRGNPALFKFAKSAYETVVRPEKGSSEINFWRMQYQREGGTLEHSKFEGIMREMSKPLNPDDFAGKVVADFGCGPRGTLTWLTGTAHCMGIDVLIPQYLAAFPEVLRDNDMTYVTCSESHIPVQSGEVDVLFTMNALDHVNDLPLMCSELKRALKVGGVLIASFNLDEPSTVTEPQTLDEAKLESVLLSDFEAVSKRFAPKFDDDHYGGFFGRPTPEGYSGPRLLWYVGRKKAV